MIICVSETSIFTGTELVKRLVLFLLLLELTLIKDSAIIYALQVNLCTGMALAILHAAPLLFHIHKAVPPVIIANILAQQHSISIGMELALIPVILHLPAMLIKVDYFANILVRPTNICISMALVLTLVLQY